MSSVNNLNIQSATNRSNTDRYIPSPYLKVAEGYEKHFAKYMIEQMNKGIGSTKKKSTAENYYQSLLDNKRADKMVKNGSLKDIKNLILDQIYPKHKRNPHTYRAFQAQMNPSQKKNQVSISPKEEIIIKKNISEAIKTYTEASNE